MPKLSEVMGQAPPQTMAATAPPGLIAPGNIDLSKRPIVNNPDGSYSTVRSISVDQDGHSFLIPTVVGGKVVSNDDAIAHFKQTGENLGQFDNFQNADKYAQTLHNEQAASYDQRAGNPTRLRLSDVQSAPAHDVQALQQMPDVVVQAPPPEPRTTLQGLGRAAAMTTRAVGQGLGGVAGLAWDPIAAGVNKLEGAVGVDPGKHGLATAGQNVDWLMNAIGLPNPEPENATERVVAGIDRGLGGLVGGAGIGGLLKAYGPAAVNGGRSAAQAIGDALTSNLGAQTAYTVGGVGAGELAREAGAGPGGQITAGLAVGAFPALAGSARQGITAGASKLLGAPSPEAAQLGQLALDAGIPLKASQVSRSPFARLMDSTSGQIPFSGAASFQNTQQQAFNRAVGRTIGTDSPVITDDVFQRAKQGISDAFERLAEGNQLPLTPDLVQRLRTVATDSSAMLGSEAKSAVNDVLDRVVSQSQNGVLPGRAFQSIDSQIGRAMGTGGEKAIPLGDLQDALREAMQAGMSPQDAQAWAQARAQWRDMRTIEPLVAKDSVEGNISPAQLLGRVTANRAGKSAMATGTRGDLGDLAAIGQRFVKQTVPDSGTARRNLALRLLTNLGSFGAGASAGSLFGPVGALVGAGTTIGGARSIQSLLQNPAVVQRLLGNDPGVNPALLRALTNSADPSAQVLLQGNQ